MRTSTRAFLAGALALALVGGATAVARARTFDGAPPEAFFAATHTERVQRTLVVAAPVLDPPGDVVLPERASVVPDERIDRANPYDLMLHGIPIGKTRDMRD
jgi:hypothetical protein